MGTAAKRLLEFLLGPLMATVVAAAALAVVALSPLSSFPEIQRACFVTDLPDQDCVRGAFTAGISTLVAFVLVIIAAMWAMRRRKVGVTPALPVPPLVTKLFLAFCFALVFAHLIGRELGPAYSSRIDELRHFSTFTSIENLLWPLLIQLLLLEEDSLLRAAIIAVLMLITTLTPYRAVTLAIFVFGFLLPLAYLLWDLYRTPGPKRALTSIAARAVLVTLIGCAIFLSGTVDSQTRAVTATPLAPISKPGGPELPTVELTTQGRARQRLAFPLYQAAIVGHLSKAGPLPTIIDELGRKFRFTDKLNLNEFAYKSIYPGSVALGETTSLYYGEGAAYFGKAGIIWTIGVPLLFVVAWLLLSRTRLEVGAILSIALWRSSFAGLITILPALLLQLSGMFVMSRLGRFASSRWLMAPIPARFAAGLLLVLVLAAAVAQASASISDTQRKDMIRLEFAAGSGCAFDMTTIGSLPDRVDHALATPGRYFRSSLTQYTPQSVYLVLPYGQVFEKRLSEFTSVASDFTQCKVSSELSPVNISDVRTISSLGVMPLNLLTLAWTLITGFLLARTTVRLSFLPSFSPRQFGK